MYKKFNLDNITHQNKVIIIGIRGTGKSTLVNDILVRQDIQDIPTGTVISLTENVDGFYKQALSKHPEYSIHTEYSSDLVDRVLKIQGELLAKKKEARNEEGKNRDIRTVLVLDNCDSATHVPMSYRKHKKENLPLRSMVANGRRHKVFFVWATTDPMLPIPTVSH